MGVITAVLIRPSVERIVLQRDETLPLPESTMPPEPDFLTALHDSAQKIKTGEIATLDDIRELQGVASQITAYGDEVSSYFVGPDRAPLDPDAASVVWEFGQPQSWAADQTKTKRLEWIQAVFAGKTTELDIDTPNDGTGLDLRLKQVAAARIWMGDTLGLHNVHGLKLDTLAKIAAQQLKLGKTVIESGLADDPLPASNGSRVLQGTVVVEPQIDSAPKPKIDVKVVPSGQELVPWQRTAGLGPYDTSLGQPIPVQWMPKRRTTGDVEPLTRFSGEVRSHKRESKRSLRTVFAAAALAITAALAVPYAQGITGAEKRVTIPIAPRGIDEAVAPGGEILPPVAEKPMPEADRLMDLGGEYDPVKRTGAIWFSMLDDVKTLGSPKLLVTQEGELTDRYIKYMNERMPGGMSWAKAREISPGTKLPFPPLTLVQQWINQITGQAV